MIDEENSSSIPDLNYSQFLTGLGYVSSNFSENSGWMLEATYFERGRKERIKSNGTFQRVGFSRTVRFEWLYRKNRIEIDGSLSLNNFENFDRTFEQNSSSAFLSVEYLLTNRFYLGPFLIIRSAKSDNSGTQTTSKDNIYSLLLGYRTQNYMVSALFGVVDFRSESGSSVTFSDGDKYVTILNFARLY